MGRKYRIHGWQSRLHTSRVVASPVLAIKDSNTLINIRSGTTDEHEHDDEDVINPQDKIDPFDWQQLETEYLDAMAECKAEEDAQLEEFASLSRFFGVWAETISGHEQKRSHQRYAYLQSESDFRLTFRLLA
jgi:hypothetical protein